MATTVQVRRMRGTCYPCINCKFKNSALTPLTEIHAIQQQNQDWLPNVGASPEIPFAEILGTCFDFVERK